MGSIKQTSSGLKISDFEDKTLLIVDDDDSFRNRLSRAMEKKGFEVKDAKTVVDAIKLAKSFSPNFALVDLRLEDGALDYMAKPIDADDVESALLATPNSKAKPPENPMSADRVKWEHIHRVFELCNRNVSETARRLKMHRRTLQRILSKKSPR
jgi:two-component system response regulator RegA